MERTKPAGRLKTTRRLLWIAALGAIAGLALQFHQQRSPEATETDMRASYATAVGGPFELVDIRGRPFSSEQLKGRPFVIFFGFTRCPEVCPMTLNDLSLLRGELGAAAEHMQVVFVSVDPEQDTPAAIAKYLTAFDMPVIGLTGSPEQLKRAQRAYGVYARKVPVEGTDEYTVDHTATVYLMNRDGRFFGSLGWGEPYDTKIKKLQRFVRQA